MAHQDTGGLLRARCAGLAPPALGSAMTTHKAVHVASANAPLTIVDVETTPPGPGHVRIAVAACGVCGTDQGFVSGGFPNMTWPLTLGHEIAGTVAELGDGVEGFAVGDRVAVGWFGGNCNRCIPCRKGTVHAVRERAGAELALSGRLRRIGDGSGHRARPHPRRTVIRRSGADGLRRRDDVPRAAQDQGRRRRPRRGAGHRRAGPSRSAVGKGDGLRDDRDRPRCGQGGQRPRTGRPPLHRFDGR